MLVAGSMIGSGIFIVSAIIAKQVGSPGWLLVVWLVTGALTLMGIIVGFKSWAGAANFSDCWTLRGVLQEVGPGLSAITAFGLFVGICVAQTNSLFSADAWNNITFTAGEVINPRRNIPLSLAFGTILVIGLYLLANVAYLAALPFNAIQNAPSDRVASETANVIFPGAGA